MASSHSYTHTEAAKMEQIITEFFAKSLHIILESRSPYMSSHNYSGKQAVSSPSSSSSSSSGVRPRDKWFNLALRECPAALEIPDIWCQSNLEPMVIDVILVHRPLYWNPLNCSPEKDFSRNTSFKEQYPFSWSSDREELECEAKTEKIIERWIVQYESRRRPRDNVSGIRRSGNMLHTLYRKSVLLLRSLYATVRLLPAYAIFRDLNSSGKIHSFTLTYKVSSFIEPFTYKEVAEMHRFGFTPVDTRCGRLCLSVSYRLSLSDIILESSTPMSPQFIPDYVGSPLVDPLKRFPSLPMSRCSPSSLPVSRQHSWSCDIYKASSPPISFSPSPTHSESHTSNFNPSSRCFPPMNLPPHPPEISSVHKNMNFDEYCPSPNFSPSPSPSPPIYIPRVHLSKTLLRSESAPVSIPAAKLASSPVLSDMRNLPPSPSFKGTGYGNPRTDISTGLVQTDASVEKFYLGKDDIRKHSVLKISSNSSPQISFSRSSSRSFQDGFDDPDFPCPFSDVEYDDMTDPGSRPESFDQSGLEGLLPIRKSQDAAVGALVLMLKKAPPLQQDSSAAVSLSVESRPEMPSSNIQDHIQISEAPAVQQASARIASSGLVASKTMADALEELLVYKKMKTDLLRSQAGRCNT